MDESAARRQAHALKSLEWPKEASAQPASKGEVKALVQQLGNPLDRARAQKDLDIL
jgi:hypothetical protein